VVGALAAEEEFADLVVAEVDRDNPIVLDDLDDRAGSLGTELNPALAVGDGAVGGDPQRARSGVVLAEG
jgi:hypothetical protein